MNLPMQEKREENKMIFKTMSYKPFNFNPLPRSLSHKWERDVTE